MLQKIYNPVLHRIVCCHSLPYSKGGILDSYMRKVDDSELVLDQKQLKVVTILEDLGEKLKTFSPPKFTLFDKIFGSNPVTAPVGLYLHGSVGCGKTMLMDIFHAHCSVEKKRRAHFHSFMLDVHHRIHEYKKSTLRHKSSKKALDYDPIAPVAKSLSSDAWLLCLDEFQVTDIGDAMILKRLFTELFNNGTVLFATSNRAPDDLYKQGLQRSNFIPFISVLKTYCQPMCLDSGIDYRQKTHSAQHKAYFLTTEIDADKELDTIFKILASKENDETLFYNVVIDPWCKPYLVFITYCLERLRKSSVASNILVVRPKILNIKNRNVGFAITCGHILDCTFAELCDRPLGAVDYLMLSQVFHTVIIRNIPQMTRKQKSQARRFITLIDTFYDNKVRVLCSSCVPSKQLFAVASSHPSVLEDENRTLMDDLNITVGSENANASIFSGEEEIFAFERTVSRLTEMQTVDYWKQRTVM